MNTHAAACHSPLMMTAKIGTSGWVVQVSLPTGNGQQVAGGVPSPTFQFFNVAISDAVKAVEAVRKKASVTPEVSIRVVRSLSPTEIAAIPLRAGEAKPA